jgi:hypothetical protein
VTDSESCSLEDDEGGFMQKRTVVNPALMIVVQLDAAPSVVSQSSADDMADRVDVPDAHRPAVSPQLSK